MNIVDTQRLFHAYIVRGGEGGLAAAKTLAAAMVCSGSGQKPCLRCRDCEKSRKGLHPDIAVICRETGSGGTEKRDITVDQIRAVRRDAVVMPNEAAKKVYIIKEAGSMNLSAQNAMLKLLEEPPSHAAFILLEENPGRLLPTVRSRCVELNLGESPEPEAEEDAAHALAREAVGTLLKGDRLSVCVLAIRLEKLDRQAMAAFLRSVKALMAEKLREYLAEEKNGAECDRVLAIINNFDKMIEYNEYNVSSGHIAGLLSVM